MAHLQQTVYPHSGHPLAEGRAPDRVSSPAKDWRSANCATHQVSCLDLLLCSLCHIVYFLVLAEQLTGKTVSEMRKYHTVMSRVLILITIICTFPSFHKVVTSVRDAALGNQLVATETGRSLSLYIYYLCCDSLWVL